MSKRYLVTGGTGFLGAALVRRLVKAGYAVRVLDDNSRGAVRRLAGLLDAVEFIQGDIRDAETVRRAVRGVEAVCHLAFINGTEFFYAMPQTVLEVGVKGMMHVLEACRAEKVGELVLASSSEVYHLPPVIPTPENVPLLIPDPYNPRYSYAGGKLISELLAIHYGGAYLDRVLIFRPHNVYGPDMGTEHVVPQFALRMAQTFAEHPQDPAPFRLQGTGEETRAFVYIDDFIEGLLCVLERGQHLNTYHIGTDVETRIADLAHAVAACFGRTIRLETGEAPAGGTPRRCPDIRKVAALGYAPRISLAEGLARTVAWYRQSLSPSQESS